MLESLSSQPTYITPEDHNQLTSSTPSDFSAIPPILRWSDQAEVEVEGEGWWDGKLPGTIWVTEQEVAFLPDSNQGSSTTGFSIRYQSLILHAHTASTATSPSHLYCQVDDQRPKTNGAATNGNGMDADEDDEDEDDEDEDEDVQVREVRIYVPESKLSGLFNAIADCSALHASLLPNGQPSSFPFMDSMEDDEDAWEDADEDDEAIVADANEETGEGGDHGGEAGRIRSDFHSGGGPGARFRPY